MTDPTAFMAFGRSPEKIPLVLNYHRTGLSNIEIARAVNCSIALVSTFMRQRGMRSNGNREIEIVDDTHAKCKDCRVVKSFSDFPRRGAKSSIPRGAYCKPCYRVRLHQTLNGDLRRLFKFKLGYIEGRCKRAGVVFSLCLDDMLSMWEEQRGKCFYTDGKLSYNYGEGRKPNSLSVDRIDPQKGYTKHNVVLCADRINLMKQDATLDEMAIWMPEWHRRLTNLRRAA